mmetsp:Transcript_17528/g.32421  ORF Transcript_17528/g.32421 Transcript_17528/m.32421 type:complete len:203 (+) Transcript_17528:2308-2916(+)
MSFVGSNAKLRTQPKCDDSTVDNFHGACQSGVGILSLPGPPPLLDFTRIPPAFVLLLFLPVFSLAGIVVRAVLLLPFPAVADDRGCICKKFPPSSLLLFTIAKALLCFPSSGRTTCVTRRLRRLILFCRMVGSVEGMNADCGSTAYKILERFSEWRADNATKEEYDGFTPSSWLFALVVDMLKSSTVLYCTVEAVVQRETEK